MSGLPGTSTCSGPGKDSDLKSPLGTRLREPLTEARFQQLFGGAEQEPEPPAEPCVPKLCRLWRLWARACSGPGAWRLLLARLPPLCWLPHYRWRAWLLGDVVAGVTVGVVHVPQGMAFALLTSVPPVFGLYTSFFPVLIYSLLGTGRHLSTVPDPLEGNLSRIEREQLDAQRVGVAAAMAFGSGALMVKEDQGSALGDASTLGVWGGDWASEEGGATSRTASPPQLGMFVLQLGVLSTFLSEPVVKALTSGAALHVLVSQLPSLLGLSLPRQMGCFSLFKTLAAVVTALPRSGLAELTISALSLALLVPVKELNVRFRDRLPTPIPGEVVMVLLASLLCFTSSLDTRYNVQIVGLLPGGFPQPHLPNLDELPRILADSLPIALVTFAVSASLASIYADKYSYSIDPNQELLAHGVSNLISSLFSCFPNSATLATTSLLVDAGGNTQLAGLFSCTVVLLVLLWLGPFFYYLPKAVLACINISSMRQMFFQMQELPQLWHISRVDFAVWMVTWVAVVTLNVDLGLAIGMVFSMMMVVCRTQRWVKMMEREQFVEDDASQARLGWESDPSFFHRVKCLALGLAEGTELYRPLRESHKLLQIPGLCILSYPTPLYFGTRGQFRRIVEWHLGLGGGKESPKPDALPDTVGEPVRVVILDFSGVTFADAAGAREVAQLAGQCQDAGIYLLLAHCNASVLETLIRAGILDRVTPDQLFVSVQDAAAHALARLERTGLKICTVWV
ncbi:Solute carrier family 26 member 10 [Heterocephalus glaber]|uniref:Solute carrier family 26 member 10 n=1 Tax=Heterocephalus glaber TaxID=10181 RepID=G5BEC5_HETGA|nr:Solute carrier family 26 member 10 [Heterocephalus glaber]